MEPRWRKDWLSRPNLTFLGGVPEADLWLDNDGDIRTVSAEGWGFFSKEGETFELRCHTGAPEVRAAMPAIELYLQLFAPWVLEKKDGA